MSGIAFQLRIRPKADRLRIGQEGTDGAVLVITPDEWEEVIQSAHKQVSQLEPGEYANARVRIRGTAYRLGDLAEVELTVNEDK